MKSSERSFARRIEAVDRIQHAANGLDERIGEIELSEQELQALYSRLQGFAQQLLSVPAPGSAAALP